MNTVRILSCGIGSAMVLCLAQAASGGGCLVGTTAIAGCRVSTWLVAVAVLMLSCKKISPPTAQLLAVTHRVVQRAREKPLVLMRILRGKSNAANEPVLGAT